MDKLHLEAMDVEELWFLHERLTRILSEKITVEKLELEKRLAQLNPKSEANRTAVATRKRPRSQYPKVMQKTSIQ